MDFKVKLRQLITRQGTLKSPTSTEPPVPTRYGATAPLNSPKEEDKPPEKDISPTDEEIILSVDNVYYRDETFDPTDYILQTLPEVLDRHEISKDCKKLQCQLYVVSERVSRFIQEKQAACMKELQMVHELQNNLEEALTTCRHSRRSLADAMQQFTVASLGILSNYQKRQQLLEILQSLMKIKTLQQTDVRLRELLEEENYPGAIDLCLECQKAVLTFRYYTCISELSSKLQDTIEMIEEQLDEALAKACSKFDAIYYEKLQMAYRRLGKTQTAMDQLHMHFTTAIHNTTFAIVLGYVELCAARADTSFHKRKYQDLCKFINTDNFTPCLTDLCKAMWHIMHSYYRIMEWHKRNDYDKSGEDNESVTTLGLEANFNRRYVEQKLEHGLLRIWQDVQQKVKAFILASDLSTFKFDEFIKVLDIINRLIVIGEEFCGSKSDDLQDSIRRQSVNYFKNYHRTCGEELHMFLENEGWALCPVKKNFTIFQLMEFRFLNIIKHSHQQSSFNSPISSPSSKAETAKLTDESFFEKYYDGGNPFDINQTDIDEIEDVLPVNESDANVTYNEDSESDDSDVPEELKRDYVDEQTGELPVTTKHSKSTKSLSVKSSKGQAPILTNTTLNVLRLFGKYMQMMNVLKPVAFDVLICMSQLFEYYMFAVYIFFATNMTGCSDFMSDKLRASLRRINDNLILDDAVISSEFFGGDNKNKDKLPKPNVSPIVNQGSRETLFGLSERIVAAESLVFLAEQLKLLQKPLESLIPPAKKSFLQQFYAYTVSMAAELRYPIYLAVASCAIDYEQTLNMMINVKWDVTDIMSQHSSYVDSILREMQVFSMRLGEVSKRVPIPQEVYNILWSHCIRIATRTFVEGFASARKCSNEGRALMQLDYQQFLMKLEKITDLRPIPDKEYVEAYVKAFYLPENILEEWIIAHKEYTPKQMSALVNCISQINKKGRQKLLAMIEDMEKLKR